MTPITLNLDIKDLALRIADRAAEALFGPPSPPAHAVTPMDPAKARKAQEEAAKKLAIYKVLRLHRHLLKQLDEYQKKMSGTRGPHSENNVEATERSPWGQKLELAALAFCPWVLPFPKIAEGIPFLKPALEAFSPDNLIAGIQVFLQQAAEGRKRFEASIEGAIWNPRSFEELSHGNLFVIQEEALNELVTLAIASSPASNKVRNLSIKIDGDVLKIKGEYDAPLMWVDFSAQLEFEQKNGKTFGSLKKIEAAGIDLGDYFKSDILGAFKQMGFSPPADAELKDLSWIHLPGIARFEITRDKVVLEREPAPTGPS